MSRLEQRKGYWDDGYIKSEKKPAGYVTSVRARLRAMDRINSDLCGELTDVEQTLPNGYKGLERVRLVYSESNRLAIENLVPPSVLDKLYGASFFLAVGHVDSGVMLVNYSASLRKIAGRRFRIWNELDRILKTTIGVQNQDIIARAELIAESIEKATGFRPEELEENRRLLTTRLRGSKSTDHPVKTILVG